MVWSRLPASLTVYADSRGDRSVRANHSVSVTLRHDAKGAGCLIRRPMSCYATGYVRGYRPSHELLVPRKHYYTWLSFPASMASLLMSVVLSLLSLLVMASRAIHAREHYMEWQLASNLKLML
jgi:hypothetical protein